jgi:hypothetical protein
MSVIKYRSFVRLLKNSSRITSETAQRKADGIRRLSQAYAVAKTTGTIRKVSAATVKQ